VSVVAVVAAEAVAVAAEGVAEEGEEEAEVGKVGRHLHYCHRRRKP
jgi:hypothetical protein